MDVVEGRRKISKLSVIIPVYNERATLPEIVRRCRAVELDCEKEVVIVDDGSTDGSAEIARSLADCPPTLARGQR